MNPLIYVWTPAELCHYIAINAYIHTCLHTYISIFKYMHVLFDNPFEIYILDTSKIIAIWIAKSEKS